LAAEKVKTLASSQAKAKEEAKTFKDRIDIAAAKVDEIAVIYTKP